MPPPPKELSSVAWIGAGALGLLYASRLARAGITTHLLLRSDYAHAKAHGIQVRSSAGDFHLPPTAFHAHQSPETIPPVDAVVISTKTTSNRDLPGLLKPIITPQTLLLTLQNGLGNEEFLASHLSPSFPPSHIFGGTAFVAVHRVAPASIEHQHGGGVSIGQHVPSPTPSP